MAANEEKAKAEIVVPQTPEAVKAPKVASVKAVQQGADPLVFQAYIRDNNASEALKYYNATIQLMLDST